MKKVLFYTNGNIADILVQKYYQIDFDIIKKNAKTKKFYAITIALFVYWRFQRGLFFYKSKG